MKKKNVVIDGDKFQKEYKNKYRKELILDFIQGIILLSISCAGLFFGSKLLLKLVIYILPLFILTYSFTLFTMGISSFKNNRKQGISLFVQSLLFAFLSIYIFLNPIDTLGFVLVVFGTIIIANAIVKMFYFPNFLPIGSFIFGGILIIFSEALINFFYTLVMLFLLLYGINKISKFIYSIKTN